LQSTVEMATFGYECVAARTCAEQIIDLRLTLRYLGVPINGRAMVFGDNESVINSAAIPHSKMHKHWVALSYHRVRWAVAAGIINVHHVSSKENAADTLSEHWDLPSVWEMMKPLLFWHENDDRKSHEESKEVNKGEDVDETVPSGGAKVDVKTTSRTKEDSNVSQPHRGE